MLKKIPANKINGTKNAPRPLIFKLQQEVLKFNENRKPKKTEV